MGAVKELYFDMISEDSSYYLHRNIHSSSRLPSILTETEYKDLCTDEYIELECANA